MSGTLLAIFTKYWQPGEVKTRLAASIGPEAAAHLHRAFVETLLRRLAGVAERCVLAYSPGERRGEFAALVREVASGGRESISSPPSRLALPQDVEATRSTPDPFALPAASPWSLQPQSPGDLGARMTHFFQASLAGDADRVVLIGSDSPTLPVDFVRQAFDKLRRHEVVLGPSDDGGYYLIGMARDVASAGQNNESPQLSASPAGPHSGPYAALPPIFEGMPWSTPQVWSETIRRLDEHGDSYAVLPAWYDVDQPADLERLTAELRHLADDGPCVELRRAVDAIGGHELGRPPHGLPRPC